MSLFFLLAAKRVPTPRVRLVATIPPASAPAFFTNLRRGIILVLVLVILTSLPAGEEDLLFVGNAVVVGVFVVEQIRSRSHEDPTAVAHRNVHESVHRNIETSRRRSRKALSARRRVC